MKRSHNERKQAFDDKWARRTRYAILATIVVLGGGMAYIAYGNYQESAVHGEPIAYHIHAFIKVYEGAEELRVPANIGVPIDQSHYLAKYGPDGMSPIHTHAPDGVIHIESKDPDVTFTIGQFLNLAGIEHDRILLVNDGNPVQVNSAYTIQNGDSFRVEG